MQLFEAPARALQLIGEEVEYLTVFDRRPQLAKITWGCDEPFAEVMHPDAIDQNACQQRMIFCSQPPRQCQSSAAGGQRGIIGWEFDTMSRGGEDRQASWSHWLFGLLGVAAMESKRFGEVACWFGQSVDELLLGLPGANRCDLFIQLLQLLGSFWKILVQDTWGDQDAGVGGKQLLVGFRSIFLRSLIGFLQHLP